MLAVQLCFSDDGLAEVARTSIRAGFMEDGTRRELLDKLTV